MAEIVIAWYSWLSGLTQGPILVIQDWIEGSSVRLVSALLFGLTVPLALRSPAGWSFPGVFALGTALPLLALAAVVSLGWGAADRLAGGVARWHRPVKWVAGAAFILAGLHDTLIYWWL
jgi:hypothetical protein